MIAWSGRVVADKAVSEAARREIQALQAHLAASEARFEAIVQRSSDGVLVVDGAGVTVFANPAAALLLGRSRSQLVGREVGLPMVIGDVTEVELIASSRKLVYAEMRVMETEWEGRPCMLALLRDVTDRHRVEAELAERATHDHLTGLANRFLVEDRLRRALARLERHSGWLAVFVIDLDDFKAINDRYGHRAGDDVLVEIARRLLLELRMSDTAARFGGDEFVLVCEDMTSETCTALAGRIERALQRPIPVADTQVTVSASIGLAMTENPASSPTDIIAAADRSMYATKPRGRITEPG